MTNNGGAVGTEIETLKALRGKSTGSGCNSNNSNSADNYF